MKYGAFKKFVAEFNRENRMSIPKSIPYYTAYSWVFHDKKPGNKYGSLAKNFIESWREYEKICKQTQPGKGEANEMSRLQ